MKNFEVSDSHFPIPSSKNPWFLIPVDDPGPVRYFVLYMLSSKYATRRFVIRMLRVFVCLGGHRLWPVVARVSLKLTTKIQNLWHNLPTNFS